MNSKQMETFEKTLQEKEEETERLRTELNTIEGKYEDIEIENNNWN